MIGSGYTGSAIGKGLVDTGNDVLFYDIDDKALSRLNNQGYNTTQDINEAIKSTDISFICVPTPTKDGSIDLSYVQAAIENVAKGLKDNQGYHLVVVKSTVVPTTTETFVRPLLEKLSGKTCGKDFGLCANPEFLTQVHKTTKDPELKRWYESNPGGIKTFDDKAVIGEYDKKSGDMLEELFKTLNVPVFRTDLRTAEMIKYAHNLILASRISYWNEFFLICESLGVDSKQVADIVSNDTRIGKYGIVHGKAFGGACLPKDLEAFVDFAKKNSTNPKIMAAVLEINKYFAEKYGTRE
jgi:UDPglucose 6-dehydrogenase